MSATIGVKELAEQLGCSPYAIYKACENGTVRHVRMGKRYLIPAGEAKRILAEGLHAGPVSNGQEVHGEPAGDATDRLIQAITLQVSTMEGLKADLKNVHELLAIVVRELTA